MTWLEKLEKAKVIIKDAQAILSNDNASQEEKNKVPLMFEDAQKLKSEAEQLKSIAQMAEELDVVNDDALTIGGKAGGPGTEGEGRPSKSEFKDLKEFITACRAVYVGRDMGVKADPRLKHFVDVEADTDLAGRSQQKKDLTGATGAQGGFLMQPEQYSQIMAVAAPSTVVRSRATIIPMSSRQIQMPVLDQTSGAAGMAAFFGGMQAFWEAEGDEMDQSDASFRQTTMTAHELICYTEVTNSLLADTNALAAYLAGPLGMPGAIAWKEDYSFLRGTGVGQPQGVINAPGAVVITRAGPGAIVYEDLVNIFESFQGDMPVWVATKGAISELMLMEGPSGNPRFLWGDASTGRPNTLLGFPIEFVDKLPAVGTQGDIGLYDFRYYLVGDRERTTVTFTDTFKFKNNKTAFKAVHRVDGQPWLSAPIALADGVTTISPFSVLGAP